MWFDSERRILTIKTFHTALQYWKILEVTLPAPRVRRLHRCSELKKFCFSLFTKHNISKAGSMTSVSCQSLLTLAARTVILSDRDNLQSPKEWSAIWSLFSRVCQVHKRREEWRLASPLMILKHEHSCTAVHFARLLLLLNRFYLFLLYVCV